MTIGGWIPSGPDDKGRTSGTWDSGVRSSDYDATDDPGPVTVVEWVEAPDDDDLPGW